MTPRDLTAIWKVVAGAYEHVDVSAKCADGSILEAKDIKEILEFDNPNFRRIHALEITARTSFEDRMSLEIETRFSSTASLRVESPDDATAVRLANELSNRLREAKPWFSPLGLVRFSWVLAGAWAVLSIWNSVQRLTGREPRSLVEDRLSVIDILNLTVFVGVLFMAVVWPVDKLQEWMFPRLFFAIGRQVDEWRRRAQIRSIVGVGFILSVLSSILAAFIYDRLK
jgi:hypothetical protein